MTPCVGMNKALTSGYSIESPSNKGIFSLSNTFEDLNVDNLIVEEVATGNKANTSGTQEEGKSSGEETFNAAVGRPTGTHRKLANPPERKTDGAKTEYAGSQQQGLRGVDHGPEKGLVDAWEQRSKTFHHSS
ncbi:hypothetical protein Tco_0892723 [Tanacetum coccineum]|uniref:Uncharacterized protein n=1 Tax=Tanacetum coccineum TaxID=301880 RepID=A0ABQ5C9Y2_9ASTR